MSFSEAKTPQFLERGFSLFQVEIGTEDAPL